MTNQLAVTDTGYSGLDLDDLRLSFTQENPVPHVDGDGEIIIDKTALKRAKEISDQIQKREIAATTKSRNRMLLAMAAIGLGSIITVHSCSDSPNPQQDNAEITQSTKK